MNIYSTILKNNAVEITFDATGDKILEDNVRYVIRGSLEAENDDFADELDKFDEFTDLLQELHDTNIHLERSAGCIQLLPESEEEVFINFFPLDLVTKKEHEKVDANLNEVLELLCEEMKALYD